MTRPIPLPDCPPSCRVTATVPMAHVFDVDRSIVFYGKLGFQCDSRFGGADGVTNWADLSCGAARLMLARASGPVDAAVQAVLFYLYSTDVRALRTHLVQSGCGEAGLPPDQEGSTVGRLPAPPVAVVFDIVPRFYMPAGELRVHDPDGYCLLIGQLD